MSKTSTEAKRRWNEKHYDRMAALVPKGRVEIIRQYAEDHGTTVNGLINDLLKYELGITPHQRKLLTQQ